MHLDWLQEPDDIGVTYLSVRNRWCAFSWSLTLPAHRLHPVSLPQRLYPCTSHSEYYNLPLPCPYFETIQHHRCKDYFYIHYLRFSVNNSEYFRHQRLPTYWAIDVYSYNPMKPDIHPDHRTIQFALRTWLSI